MSEYQFVAFQAVDRPLTDEELEFAREQSTRAEITRWSFTNEYHFGDFGGDAEGLLRRGYDVHLHYANFGICCVMLRLPAGIPVPKNVWSPYVAGESIEWRKDRKGPGGILSVSPYLEPGDLDHIWNPEEYLGDLVQLRNELVDGDLRALFTLWVCARQNDYREEGEDFLPPIPAGMGQASRACRRMFECYGIDPLVCDAAAEWTQGLPSPGTTKGEEVVTSWIEKLSPQEARKLLREFLTENTKRVRAETMAMIRAESEIPQWPIMRTNRTLEELLDRVHELREIERERERARQAEAAKREADRKARERQKRLQQMKQNPQAWFEEAAQLVERRGTANYEAAAEILADLRQALGNDDQTVYQHAKHLAERHPTLTRLKGSLRKKDLLPK